MQKLPLLNDTQEAQLDDLYRKRIETLHSVDDLIENVVNTLQTAGKLDNTFIVFSSDNGFHLGEHRETAGKQAPYEENIRLPLIVRGPGIAAGKTMDQLVRQCGLRADLRAVGGRDGAGLRGWPLVRAAAQRGRAGHMAAGLPDRALRPDGRRQDGQSEEGQAGKNGKNATNGTAQPAAPPTPAAAIGSTAAGRGKGAKATRAGGAPLRAPARARPTRRRVRKASRSSMVCARRTTCTSST